MIGTRRRPRVAMIRTDGDEVDPPALRVRGLEKSYAGVGVLRGLDLEATRGEFLALLGPSGCGKTTALRLIAGFERAQAGTIEIGGECVCAAGGAGNRWVPPEGRRVGMVFQDYALFPHLNVAQNVAFGLPRHGSDRAPRVKSALATVGLSGLGERSPDKLSGGQQQRVALARALAPGPEVILLDEPFSNLDADLRASVREEVRQILREAGATAVLVTHDQEEALSIADRVAVILDGKIVQAGPPEELYHRPATRAIADFIGDVQFLPGMATGRRAVTVLGEIPLHAVFEGAVEVMLRPEMLRLTPASEGDEDAVMATIVSRAFFGHDQLLTIHLDSGHALKARLGAYGGFRPGDRVSVSVRGGALAYPHEQ
ncbi:MAG: ABC transporter ATP-binding protein [Chloroflexota bacterium]|nr:ABC transporter ATP-binding protein [Chloroflexota bacterium]